MDSIVLKNQVSLVNLLQTYGWYRTQTAEKTRYVLLSALNLRKCISTTLKNNGYKMTYIELTADFKCVVLLGSAKNNVNADTRQRKL